MYTADMANSEDGQANLDQRIKWAVQENDAGYKAAYLRIYIEDPWVHQIEYELERRGFKNIRVPSIVLKGDVYFEWGDREDED
jgi:hypothetical protein